ncbi:DUF2382 domain-containing protein [Mastigocoleus sp. MO_188.B34]|uniref:DUF2382 domain-containing protein n=1 Tax=Mastigocoleus sp. MO_188.B34 TaxID=3036635 RepID=UPI0026273CEB|nr:DUF2382 domain-containing protein [Mastigocoleus sp. MO_188.B34]MDJ0695885.1 DUF2382 domain-containing protein [Mastigocoleus sp. MO_188.B34]
MALYKIADLYPNYKEDIFAGDDIKDFSVYSEADEKVGSIHDVIVDGTGRFRYFIIDTGFWVFGKKVLLPIGRATIDYNEKRVYAVGLRKDAADRLPEYNDDMVIDFDYEERVRAAYRNTGGSVLPAYDSTNYSYDSEPELYQTDEKNHQNLKLYEERLVASKDRFRTGAVTIGKKVETETAEVVVPIEKERVIIERTASSETQAVAPGTVDFKEGEVARVEVYEESANIEKQAFVREEVSVRKEVEKDSVEAKEKLRREELEVDVDGNPTIQHK